MQRGQISLKAQDFSRQADMICWSVCVEQQGLKKELLISMA